MKDKADQLNQNLARDDFAASQKILK